MTTENILTPELSAAYARLVREIERSWLTLMLREAHGPGGEGLP